MADDMTLPVGFRLGSYEVARVLGSGTFGNVYLCSDGGDEVVLREYMPRGLAVRGTGGDVRPQLAAADSRFKAGLTRFVARAERLADAAYPNIVRIHRVFFENGTAYVAMDHVPGTTLAASLEPSQTLPPRALAAHLLPVLDGLRAMHRDGLAHGNIGLGSIVTRNDATPVLLGVAVLPRDEFGVVTRPNYAPIERYSSQGGLPDRRTDVYSIGAIMYRCIIGVPPPEAPLRADRDTLVPAARAAGRRSGYSEALTRAIDASLAIRPQDRPGDLDGLRTALSADADGHATAGEPPEGDGSEAADQRNEADRRAAGTRGRAPQTAVGSRRARKVAFAAAAAGATLIAAVALWRSGVGDAPGPAERPTSEPIASEADAAGAVPEPATSDATAPAAEPAADDLPAALVVETAPPGARVLLDGDEVGETPLLAPVPPGDWVVTLTHPLFDTVELPRSTLGPGEELRIDRELVRSTGGLRLTGTPADAWIEQDGRRVAEGLPATLESLPTGPVVLAAGADGHESATIAADVQRDTTSTVEVALEPILGTLTLVLLPADADVVLDGGEEPYLPGMEIPVGTHRVDVSSAGYRSASRTFEVTDATTVAVALEPIPQPLTIVTDPRGATVDFVDAPLSYRDGMLVTPGEYALRAVLLGYAPWTGTVQHGFAPTVHTVSLQFTSAEYADPLAVGGDGPTMTVVPAGSFELGCGADPACPEAENPVQPVTFEAPFALSKYEATFEDYDRFAVATGRLRPPDAGWGRGRRPAINVTWHDATAYAEWLSEQTGRPYRLPTEAEWEYAARADTATAYHWGDAADSGGANCDGCDRRSPGRTLPVGFFDANAWGLHDMHGNVWEWVEDCWSASHVGRPSSGAARTGGDCGRRVLRGGSWFNAASFARSASRLSGNPDVRGTIAGFRLAVSFPVPTPE